MAVEWRKRPFWTAARALDIPARTRRHLPFRILLTAKTDSWIDRSGWNSSGGRLFASGSSVGRARAFLVRTDLAVVFQWIACADGIVLDGSDCIAVGGGEYIASCRVADLLRVFSLICERSGQNFPDINPTECCWRPDLFLYSLRR